MTLPLPSRPTYLDEEWGKLGDRRQPIVETVLHELAGRLVADGISPLVFPPAAGDTLPKNGPGSNAAEIPFPLLDVGELSRKRSPVVFPLCDVAALQRKGMAIASSNHAGIPSSSVNGMAGS